ncbi:MAG: hypothetical protein ISN28_12260 [Ectothiorhodospiraceae bacterium AqS1]|nr:hypothetical protein [Ectothiorhodospiraceae bacterium AqS1]
MRVIVSDSSVLIDVAKARLIESALALPYVFVLPDVMLDEILDLEGLLEGYTWKDLQARGLRAEEQNSEGVTAAIGYAEQYQRLSSCDAFALALAKSSDSMLLTGDDALRQAAVEQTVDVHGHLWLSDEMERCRTVTRENLLTTLVAWESDTSVWLPAAEIKARIKRLRDGGKSGVATTDR